MEKKPPGSLIPAISVILSLWIITIILVFLFETFLPRDPPKKSPQPSEIYYVKPVK